MYQSRKSRFMRSAAVLVILIPLIGGTIVQDIRAQEADFRFANSRALLESPYGILSNSITNLSLQNDSLWIGPYLNLSFDDGRTWYAADTDSLFGTSNRTYSLDAGPGVVAVGLGKIDNAAGGVQTATGFLMSEDGGETFEYRFPQLDQPGDSSIVYGVSTLKALAIIVPQQSPPFDLDYNHATGDIWLAGWASGIRRSSDMGRTWKRVVLPPDDLDYVTPDSSYDFLFAPKRGGTGSLNHMGFSVLVDSKQRVWAGTAGGVNRSLDGGLSWQKFTADGTSRSIVGNWIISLEEQVIGDESIIWMANWSTGEVPGERFGITFTRDGGNTFRQALQGERIYDFSFVGNTVYAAGESGLFISDDGGEFWRSIRDFRGLEEPGSLIGRDEPIFSVESDSEIIWAGTSSGLLLSVDDGVNWSLDRVNVPLSSSIDDPRVPTVETFAYPNPFSPAGDGFIRIRYELSTNSSVEIRIFDFAMNLVRTLELNSGAGISEARWDGMSESGVRVANGPYFYEVKADGKQFRGKILVIE
jgi:photosystem II stability/assembly factor-like uncharacterized protein